jgi:hypothetical protein
MRKITIVGAGQAGLQLGIGLLRKGYDITIVSDKTADQIRNGRITSSQGMFGWAINNERERGLRLWEDEYKGWGAVQMNVVNPVDGSQQISFTQPMGYPGGVECESIDQRVKMPAWMNLFEELGGKLIIEEADIESLERYEAESDLVLVASGKGQIGKLFETDEQRTFWDAPPRNLALLYVKGMKAPQDKDGQSFRGLTWNTRPGVGEYFSCNALTLNGECDIMILEAVPGGPADLWDGQQSNEEILANALKVLKDFYPHEYERCKDGIELTDDQATLKGCFRPITRKPVLKLPNGKLAMGVADAVCLNDPICGQGANNASKFAQILEAFIVQQGDKAFDEDFMNAMFEAFWDHAKHVVKWNNTMLFPPQQAQVQLLTAAADSPKIAGNLVRAFENAELLEPHFYDADACQTYIHNMTRDDLEMAVVPEGHEMATKDYATY